MLLLVKYVYSSQEGQVYHAMISLKTLKHLLAHIHIQLQAAYNNELAYERIITKTVSHKYSLGSTLKANYIGKYWSTL